MTTKVQFYLTEEALEVINQSATERKRGEWLSNVVLDYQRITSGIPAPVDDSAGVLEKIDSRLANLEKQIGLIASHITK